MNVASRMESHGVSGEINISSRVYELLGQDYEFEDRGEIFIKGKGKMNTYLLKGKKIFPRINQEICNQS